MYIKPKRMELFLVVEVTGSRACCFNLTHLGCKMHKQCQTWSTFVGQTNGMRPSDYVQCENSRFLIMREQSTSEGVSRVCPGLLYSFLTTTFFSPSAFLTLEGLAVAPFCGDLPGSDLTPGLKGSSLTAASLAFGCTQRAVSCADCNG